MGCVARSLFAQRRWRAMPGCSLDEIERFGRAFRQFLIMPAVPVLSVCPVI